VINLKIEELTDIKDIVFVKQIQDKLEEINYCMYYNHSKSYNYLTSYNDYLVIKMYYNNTNIYYDKEAKIYEMLIGNSNNITLFKFKDIEVFLLIFNIVYNKIINFTLYKEKQYEKNICFILLKYDYITLIYNDINIRFKRDNCYILEKMSEE
jgi:hypothetical protein